MLAAIATIIFLGAALVVAGIAAITIEAGAARIAAALRGCSLGALSVAAAPAVRFSPRARARRPVQAAAQWRAAA